MYFQFFLKNLYTLIVNHTTYNLLRYHPIYEKKKENNYFQYNDGLKGISSNPSDIFVSNCRKKISQKLV